MIDIFESTAQLRPEAVFFTAVDRRGNETAYTYRQTVSYTHLDVYKRQTFLLMTCTMPGTWYILTENG